jgi:hypothetical protein
MWQRGRIALLRWLHLVQIARTPADRKGRAADPCPDPPRRLAATLTPGLVKEALAARFRNFEAFRLLPETYRKSGPVRSTRNRPGCLSTAQIQRLQDLKDH